MLSLRYYCLGLCRLSFLSSCFLLLFLFLSPLKASNLTTPNGSLEVCYDERGYQYKVPQYCYANPVELTFEPTPVSSAVETLSTESVRNNNNSSNINAGNSNKNEVIMPNTGPQIKLKIRVNPGNIFLSLALLLYRLSLIVFVLILGSR
jgi:hypothetical protein